MDPSPSRRNTWEGSTSSRPRTWMPRSSGHRRPPKRSASPSRFARSGRCATPRGRRDDGSPSADPTAIGRIFREESGRAVATLIRIFGDIDVAEDAVQEAFVVAVRKWPIDGLPPNPGGWITTTARNRAIHRLRRVSPGRDLLDEVAVLPLDDNIPNTTEQVAHVEGDRLRI